MRVHLTREFMPNLQYLLEKYRDRTLIEYVPLQPNRAECPTLTPVIPGDPQEEDYDQLYRIHTGCRPGCAGLL